MARELEIISLIRERARARCRALVGIGDDAAVIEAGGANDIIACCDLSVEGVHFRTEWASARLIGRKALAVTLSDVAAMGGAARFAMVAVALPGKLPREFIEELFGGIFEMAEACGVSIIGGDTSSSPDSIFIDTIALGDCPRGQAVTRGGARAGDRLYVTGTLGASRLGLTLLEKGFKPETSSQDQFNELELMRRRAILKHLAPEPRLKIGEAIGREQLATAMIDVSDGVSTDLSHILEESKRGAILRAESIPIDYSLHALAQDLEIDPLSYALHGGEEYELIFTAAPDKHLRIAELSDTLNIAITHIGEIVDEGGLRLERDGRLEPLAPSGYEHSI